MQKFEKIPAECPTCHGWWFLGGQSNHVTLKISKTDHVKITSPQD